MPNVRRRGLVRPTSAPAKPARRKRPFWRWTYRTRVQFPREGGGLARLADEYEVFVAFDDCLELRFDVPRLEQEIGRFASGALVRLGRHADVIHAARVGAFAEDLEILGGPPAIRDDVLIHLPKQVFVLSYASRSLVHSQPPVRCYPRRRAPRHRTRHLSRSRSPIEEKQFSDPLNTAPMNDMSAGSFTSPWFGNNRGAISTKGTAWELSRSSFWV